MLTLHISRNKTEAVRWMGDVLINLIYIIMLHHKFELFMTPMFAISVTLSNQGKNIINSLFISRGEQKNSIIKCFFQFSTVIPTLIINIHQIYFLYPCGIWFDMTVSHTVNYFKAIINASSCHICCIKFSTCDIASHK